MKKIICSLFITIFVLQIVMANDLMSFIEGKDFFPIEFLEILKSEDRNTVLNFNPDIIKNTEYDFAYERNTAWYEPGTFCYLFLTKKENEIELGRGLYINIDKCLERKGKYILLGKQTEFSKGAYYSIPSIIDIDPLIDLDESDKIEIRLDGDYLTFSVKSRNFYQEYFFADKNTIEQIVSLITTNKCDLSKVTWPRHADGTCDYDENNKTTKSPVSTSSTTTAPSTNVTVNKTMLVTENLKLRSGEATSTKVLSVMAAGTKVKILEVGKAETIDGIKSNWVKVEVQKNAKDRDGKAIKTGTVGWCYGGYLK